MTMQSPEAVGTIYYGLNAFWIKQQEYGGRRRK
jgi:hypothetical protein